MRAPTGVFSLWLAGFRNLILRPRGFRSLPDSSHVRSLPKLTSLFLAKKLANGIKHCLAISCFIRAAVKVQTTMFPKDEMARNELNACWAWSLQLDILLKNSWGTSLFTCTSAGTTIIWSASGLVTDTIIIQRHWDWRPYITDVDSHVEHGHDAHTPPHGSGKILSRVLDFS